MPCSVDLSKILVKNVRELELRHGVAFTLDVTIDGEVVATAENAGRGGCNRYIVADRPRWAQIVAAVEAELPDEIEGVDSVICCCVEGDNFRHGIRVWKKEVSDG